MRFNTTALLSLASQNWKSGLTVALISVPLSIALSIASGAGPIPGIITGIWATAIAAVFGSNHYNVIGAAGALTTVLFAAALNAPLALGAAVLPLLAIATGILIFFIWLTKLDRFLYYIPSSVMYGFAAGVAFLIAASQVFDATGLSALKRTGTFLGDILLFGTHTSSIHVPTLLVFAGFLAFILVWKRFIRSLPAVIPAALAGIIFGFAESNFFSLDLISLGEKFGGLAGGLFLPIGSALDTALGNPEILIWLFKGALIIALIAVLETLITARIADKITHTQSSSSRELLGLSLANLGAGFMGGLPATGVFIRTGANIKAGATHRMSAFLAALFTAIIAVIVLPFFAYLPVAVIAAVLVNTALGLIETEKFKEFWHYEKQSFSIAVIVATITVFEDAGIAVLVGAVLALLMFAHAVSRGRFDAFFTHSDGRLEERRGLRTLVVPDDKLPVVTYSIAGYLGYIDAARHAANFRHLAQSTNVEHVIIRLRNLFSIDYEAKEMLRDAIVDIHTSGKKVYISSASPDVAAEIAEIPHVQEHVENPHYDAKTGDVLTLIQKSA